MSESTPRGSSGAPRAINDAKIRAVAAEVECIVICLKAKAKDLHCAFDSLHDEIYLADPERDREFDRFLLAVAHTNNALNTLLELEERAKVMQQFGLEQKPVTFCMPEHNVCGVTPGLTAVTTA